MSASALGIAARGHKEEGMEPGDTPRYGAGANIENHPQVTDYVPRRFRVIALYLLGAVTLAASGEVVALYATSLADWAQVVSADLISSRVSAGLLAWTSATVLLVSACFSLLIYSLRRHRVDDNRGRYRIWRWDAWACVGLSLNAVVGAHAIVAPILGHLTGWSVLPGNLMWWLIPAALVGSWLLLKVIIESSECRAALSCYLLASLSLLAAGVFCFWSPSWAVEYQDSLHRMLPVAANIFLMTGTLLFGRYVVLDVQGLVEHKDNFASAELSVASVSKRTHKEDSEPSSSAKETCSEESSWVDGSEPESDYEDQGQRKLSKAERKRLRKQKQRRRAA